MRAVLAAGSRALLALLPLFAASFAAAEPVTYHLTGTLSSVTDGSGSTLDVRPTFTVGAAFTLDITVERSTPSVTYDNITYFYPNAGTALSFTTGGYACTGALTNLAAVQDDQVAGVLLIDKFVYQAKGLSGPQVSTATSSELDVMLRDDDGTAFSSRALPRIMPDLSSFESTLLELWFTDDATQRIGYVSGTFDGLTTPARATSWGRIKADYR